MAVQVNSFSMPFSNVAHLPFHEKLAATQVAGYNDLSLMPIEVEQITASGISPSDMRKQAEDAGITIGRLDPLNTWSRVWRPDNMDEAYIATVDTPPDRFFALCEAVGAKFMSLNATFPLRSMDWDEITEHYARICARAADHGMSCDLEFIPFWGVPTLEMAWKIVKDSAAPNGGLVIDTWHLVRSGSDINMLREIPGSFIHCVQLSDGLRQLPEGRTLLDDNFDRRFPGTGEFPNVELVEILAETGGLNQVGPEIFSPTLRSMTFQEVGALTKESIDTVIGAAETSVGAA